jgi:hypothetical protein
MDRTYRDRRIECGPEQISIRGYYFPWGTKHIAYRDIRGARLVELSGARGRGRVWGTANPRYWANFDPRRPAKRRGVILDVGGFVHPVLTPDDAESVAAIIGERTGRAVVDDAARGPLL